VFVCDVPVILGLCAHYFAIAFSAVGAVSVTGKDMLLYSCRTVLVIKEKFE